MDLLCVVVLLLMIWGFCLGRVGLCWVLFFAVWYCCKCLMFVEGLFRCVVVVVCLCLSLFVLFAFGGWYLFKYVRWVFVFVGGFGKVCYGLFRVCG